MFIKKNDNNSCFLEINKIYKKCKYLRLIIVNLNLNSFKSLLLIMTLVGHGASSVASASTSDEVRGIPLAPCVLGMDGALGIPVQETNTPFHKSWQPLSTFTKQTINNFKNNDPRGIFIVHSFENIMGASKQMRYLLEADEYSNLDFVRNYAKLLSTRTLISTSLLFLGTPPHPEQPTLGNSPLSNYDSFGKFSVILEVPRECIVLANKQDAYTQVEYLKAGERSKIMSEETPTGQKLLDMSYHITLDEMVHSPNFFRDFEDKDDLNSEFIYRPIMNEVAILSCARLKDGTLKSPSIVALFENQTLASNKIDMGNSIFNRGLAEAVKVYAKEQNLPYLVLSNSQYPGSGYHRAPYWGKKLEQPDNPEVRLSIEDLAAYGLSLVPSPKQKNETEINNLQN